MGLHAPSIWQLLILLLIIVMVFGTKKLRNMGGDLGAAVKSFRKGLEEVNGSGAEKPEVGQIGADADLSSSARKQPSQKNSSPSN
jgi:sec-independent protein translocase protein TatA